MSKKIYPLIYDKVNIIWAITSKDIFDAIKNKTVVSMAIMLSLILLMPKMLPLIFEQPLVVLPIYDEGNSTLVEKTNGMSEISVKKLPSETAFNATLCGGVYPQTGLRIPEDFDKNAAKVEQVTIQGYVCWSKRRQVSALDLQLEEMLSEVLDKPATIEINQNFIYPPTNGALFLSMTTINSVLMILMMGIFLVPTLLIEEKENKTLQALLISPAGIGEVVVGKALTGSFYILVTAAMIFAFSWVEVIHWNMVILFVLAGGLFSVAVGLLLGSLFEKQQDMIGWTSAVLIFLISAIFIEMYALDVPTLVSNLIQWVPSVGLSEICMAAFSETYATTKIMTNLVVIAAVSLVVYAIVIWKIRRSDQ